MKKKDLTGKRFGRLTVIRKDGHLGEKTAWLCKCDCGNYKRISTDRLTTGKTQSCGCLRNEMVRKALTTHGMRHTKIYKIWEAMKRRCNSPKCDHYILYGGRGIRYIPEWDRFVPFYKWALSAGYKEGLSIDRIDVNGNYEPENCRWIPLKQQAYNKTTSHYLTLNGKTMTVTEWSKSTGIPTYDIFQRISKLHWSVKRALTEPVKNMEVAS